MAKKNLYLNFWKHFISSDMEGLFVIHICHAPLFNSVFIIFNVCSTYIFFFVSLSREEAKEKVSLKKENYIQSILKL